MTIDDGPANRFLVEWYRPGLASSPPADTAEVLAAGVTLARAAGHVVAVELTMSAPDDDTVFGVFAAESAEAVRRVCCDAGYPPDRITGDIRTFIAPTG